MRVLIACESSGVVRRAFAALGHDAVSCDLLPAEDGETSQHVTGDVLPLLSQGWDLLIAHPPCTYLCGANAGHMRHGCSLYTAEQAVALRDDAARFFMAMVDAPIEHIAVENPVGCMSSRHRKPERQAAKTSCRQAPTDGASGARHIKESQTQWRSSGVRCEVCV